MYLASNQLVKIKGNKQTNKHDRKYQGDLRDSIFSFKLWSWYKKKAILKWKDPGSNPGYITIACMVVLYL